MQMNPNRVTSPKPDSRGIDRANPAATRISRSVVITAIAFLAAVLALSALWGSAQRVSAVASTIYVDEDAPAGGNGLSWGSAYTDLQDALNDAQPSDEIWVAEGIYLPSIEHAEPGARFKSFQMLNGVGIYGGFDPTTGDTGWEDRDWVNNVTTLSGDLGLDGNPLNNSYHVFYHPLGLNLDETAILDGFTISDGSADEFDYPPHEDGAGMLNIGSSPTLANCIFEDNEATEWGGGIYNEDASPQLTNCTFRNNGAGYDGGGVYNRDSSPAFESCAFVGNWSFGYGGGVTNRGGSPIFRDCDFVENAAEWSGGGIANLVATVEVTDCSFVSNEAIDLALGFGVGGGLYNSNSTLVLTNSTFAFNDSDIRGGAIENSLGTLTATNCTFYGNTTGGDGDRTGGAIYNWAGSTLVLTNCILWGDTPDELDGADPQVTYSDVQGGIPGDGNIDEDPRFVDPDAGDFHLQAGSGAIDTGTNDAPNLPPFDFEGDDRIIDGDADGAAIVDMGVDEALEVEPAPITGLTAINNSPTELGDTTSFTATVESGDPVSYAWAFGDGQFGSGDEADHTYPGVGFYTAVVTASNSLGELSTTTPVTITDVPISGLMAINDSPTELGSATTLTATLASGSNVSYAWDFGDGAFGDEREVTHTYAGLGIYTAVVTASNSLGELYATTTVTITDEPISGLQAMNDSPTELGSPTSFAASVASGGSVSYAWAFGDGDMGSSSHVIHTYPDVGTYTAVVTASNSGGELYETTTVTITDVPISGLVASNDSPTELGSATTLTATVTGGSNVTYAWAFGDGEFGSGWELTHTYAGEGFYTAVVTATNGISLVEDTTLVEVYQPFSYVYLPLVRYGD